MNIHWKMTKREGFGVGDQRRLGESRSGRFEGKVRGGSELGLGRGGNWQL